MIVRCYYTHAREYPFYGGRGIRVCRRWQGKNGFTNFVADMGERPEGCTIDRRDNNKGYSPENCRWATKTQQRRNVRGNRILESGGTRHTLSEWAEITGLSRTTIAERLRRGWPIDRALTPLSAGVRGPM